MTQEQCFAPNFEEEDAFILGQMRDHLTVVDGGQVSQAHENYLKLFSKYPHWLGGAWREMQRAMGVLPTQAPIDGEADAT